MPIDWNHLIDSGLVSDLAPTCTTYAELAGEIGRRTGETVSAESLRSGWRRHGLGSLRELLGSRTMAEPPAWGDQDVSDRPHWDDVPTPVDSTPMVAAEGIHGATHLIIPDTQQKPDTPTEHFDWIGRLAQDVQPDVIIHLGDHWDMPSFSSYDKGKKCFVGRNHQADFDAGNEALERLERALGGYRCRKVMLRGNHEERILRAIEQDPERDGTIGYHKFNDVELGWEVVDFLKPIMIDGVKYAHYFVRSADGMVKQSRRGMANARIQVQREQVSCTAGHQQGLDYCQRPVGHRIHHGLIAGSCYLHDEGYLTPQGNRHWRGVVVKTRVIMGDYSPKFFSLEELQELYG